MKISKAKFKGSWTFDDYELELSFQQLLAIKNALATDHSDPISDELFAQLDFYLANLPGPGEDPDSLKKAEDAAASGLDSPEASEKPSPRSSPADDLLPRPDAVPDLPPSEEPTAVDEPLEPKSEADRRVPPPEEA